MNWRALSNTIAIQWVGVVTVHIHVSVEGKRDLMERNYRECEEEEERERLRERGRAESLKEIVRRLRD